MSRREIISEEDSYNSNIMRMLVIHQKMQKEMNIL